MSILQNPFSKIPSATLFLLGIGLLLSMSAPAFGVPYFARKYGVTCATCHVIPPKLNQTGENFVNNGYEFPDVQKTNRTWPFALWLTQRGESQPSRDIQKTFPNKIELISGGPIGSTGLSYFLEWRILSLETRSDGSLKDRSGRFEDLFIDYAFRDAFLLTVGQYRLLRQIDNSRKLSLSTPVVIGASIAGSPAGTPRKTALRAFAPEARSPAISLEYHAKGAWDADGWFTTLSLPFPGEFSIPLTREARQEASFEMEFDPKGVFLESFYRWGLGSVGGHLFLDDGRALGSLLGVYHSGPYFATVGVGFGRQGGQTNRRLTGGLEYIPTRSMALGARLDHQTRVSNATTFSPYINLLWPGTQWSLQLVVEQRVRANNHATLSELSLHF